jgi:alkanesulfonate monooxygenase SsuD/methylene tetrahydromethanopterin reductase-like flavin-dependent oxidoreductase (luciferase family)
VADGIAFNLINSDAWLRDVLIPAALAGLARSHRTRSDLDLGMLRFCSIDDEPAVARDRLRSALGFYFTVPYFAEMLRHAALHAELAAGRAAAQEGDEDAMAAAVSDEMIATFALAGTADQVRAQLRSYAGALDWVLLCPPLADTSAGTIDAARRIIDVFGTRAADEAP